MDLFQHPTVAGLAALLDSAEEQPRQLLHELTKRSARTPVRTYICIPYGGGPAAVYQPVADQLPAGHRLLSLAIPGHDIGLDETAVDFDELARRCAEEVLERTEGPLVLYGHCGVGGAMIVALALQLEAAGREIEAVYAGGIFASARPTGMLARFHDFTERIASNRTHVNWLKGMGVDIDVLGPEQADRVIANMRHDGEQAEDFFTDLFTSGHARLRAPIISIVGERDPLTDYYTERFREWRSLTDTAAVAVLSEGGHFFLRYRAREVAEILTQVPDHLAAPSAPALSGDGWKLAAVSRVDDRADPGRPTGASMRRFGLVAAGQLVSSTGSALTGFAIPIWVLQHTGSLLFFGLMAALAFLPAIIATPVAGALADRYDRRKIMLYAGAAALSAEAIFSLILWARGTVALGAVYAFVFAIAMAGSFQRITFVTAIPQLVPKVFLGHANGIAQLVTGTAMMFAPLLGAGLYAAIGLGGILAIDIVSYLFAITVLLAVRFPNLMGRLRKETFAAQLLGGLRLTWATKHFRAMLVFYALLNLVFAVPLLMVTPLVLAFGSMADVGWAAFAEAAGGVAGGLLMAIWGGPRRRMMVVNILAIVAAGVFVAATGVHAHLAVIALGVFGSAVMLAIANAIYFTVIQIKIPQRYHGRVFALNQTLAWSTFPLGFAVLPPLIDRYLTRPMMAHGSLAHSVGRVIGTGPGRGIGLAFILAGLLMAMGAAAGLGVRRLANLDADVPDALPDDLVGVQELAAQTGGTR
jgi:surfactin synthase thioesterase subunit/MFS family permease